MSVALDKMVGAAGVIALAAGTLGVIAPAAMAATGPVTYSCTTGGGATPFNATVEIDAAPDRVEAGKPLTFTTKVTVPASARAALPSPADSVDGTADLAVTSTGPAQTVRHTVPRTPVPATGDIPLTATGTWTPTQSGDAILRAGELKPTLQFYNGTATAGTPVALTCTAPTPAPTIDTISVTATSTTAVKVNDAKVQHGKRVTATATVTTTGGPAAGSVVFAFGSRTETVPVQNGVASSTLRADLPPKSAYPFTATFQPTDTKNVTGSTASANVKVKKDGTNVQVRVGDFQRGRKVKARVSINSIHGEEVEGRVEVILKRGNRTLRVKTKRLDDEQRTVGLLRLYDLGRYEVRVKYLGSSEFKKSNDRDGFRVVRR